MQNNLLSTYLAKQKSLCNSISENHSNNLGIIVVIPCYNEPNLFKALNSISQCLTPNCSVEILVILNSSSKDSESVFVQNNKTLAEFNDWREDKENEKLSFHIEHFPDLQDIGERSILSIGRILILHGEYTENTRH